jgi:hypothetical protein
MVKLRYLIEKKYPLDNERECRKDRETICNLAKEVHNKMFDTGSLDNIKHILTVNNYQEGLYLFNCVSIDPLYTKTKGEFDKESLDLIDNLEKILGVKGSTSNKLIPRYYLDE